MKRDVIILVIATFILTALAYNGRPTDKAGIMSVYTVVSTEAIAETETMVVEVAEVVPTGFVMYSDIWDKVQMTFYPDGSCVFEMPEYEVLEQCTWTYSEGILKVARTDGWTFTSYMAEDGVTLKLDYVSLTHEKLIGQMSSMDYKNFFEAE